MPPPKKIHEDESFRVALPKPTITPTDEGVRAIVQDRIDRAEAGLPVPELEGKPIITYGDIARTDVAVSNTELAATMRSPDEICRFTSIGGLFRLRKLPAQPMLPERIILERRVSHLHEKEEWDLEWRQQ